MFALTLRGGSWIPTLNGPIHANQLIIMPIGYHEDYQGDSVEIELAPRPNIVPPPFWGKVFKKDANGFPFIAKCEMYEMNVAKPKWEEFIANHPRRVCFNTAELMGVTRGQIDALLS